MIYAKPDGICIDEFQSMDEVSDRLEYLQEMNGSEIVWGKDLEHGEVTLITKMKMVTRLQIESFPNKIKDIK